MVVFAVCFIENYRHEGLKGVLEYVSWNIWKYR